ncbi:dihydrodipicolinate synthase family protein [Mesobacillus harenae]|uniref:dihydrodipicolinate synthase family protein n=1 Tax=Mesobacillus harenae TaxID=2213203 RepID=UPI00157FD1BB|nr:dihydrodipicolinate synthase family protein [Mesobacillus harenae]
MTTFPNGIWPTMITPFTPDNKVDYLALEQLIEWYISKGVDGLFAVCQSSEMFQLTLDERVELSQFVVTQAKNRVPVVSSGHISDDVQDQITELQAISNTGVDAVVLVTNRLAKEDESDDVWIENAEKILNALPDMPFGLYECPYPYKRLLSDKLTKWCAASGRFYFLKDTSCKVEDMVRKIELCAGSNLKIFNANAPTLLDSLKIGVSGYSGIMANFHPELYSWLVKNWQGNEDKASKLQSFLGIASVIEKQLYPTNAKYYHTLEDHNVNINGRNQDCTQFTSSNRLEVEQLHEFTQHVINEYTETVNKSV